MQVWILERSEREEGGAVLGLYTEDKRDEALIDLKANAIDMNGRGACLETAEIVRATGEVKISGFCDVLELTLHDVRRKAFTGSGEGERERPQWEKVDLAEVVDLPRDTDDWED